VEDNDDHTDAGPAVRRSNADEEPGFTAVAIVALALAIGANTAMYSIINAMLLPPFPFRDLDRAVSVWEAEAKRTSHAGGPGQFP